MKKFLLFILGTFLAMYLPAQNMIKAYEYWLDDDITARTLINITPATAFRLQEELPLPGSTPGFHIFNIRFLDTDNNWSVLTRQYVIKMPVTTSQIRQIVAFEYWIDDNISGKVYQTITPSSAVHLTTPVNLNSVTTGFHILSIRFRDDLGSWSLVTNQYFTRFGASRIIPNTITTCRLWYDNDPSTLETISFPQSATVCRLSDTLEPPFLTTGNHTINYQFRDSTQSFSSVRTDTFNVTSCLPHGGRAISGLSTVSKGQSGVVYSIRKIRNASSYTWSFPSGVTIASGGNTHSVTVDISPAAVSGDISVFATNSCGNGETMHFPVTVNAGSGSPAWVPMPNPQYNMTVIGKIQISPGVYSLNENDILGAFVGEDCRGVASPFPGLGGILFLTIGSNLQSGENITFKIYLSSSDQVVDANESFPFQNSGEMGTMSDPFIFTFGGSPCTLAVTPSSRNVPSTANTKSFYVNTTAGCNWTAASDQSWCTILSPSGSGSGTLSVTCSQNPAGNSRTANVAVTINGIAPVIVTVNQAGTIGPPNWIPLANPQFNMSVIGKIEVAPLIYSLNPGDIVGAFVDQECRGIASPNPALGGTLFLTIGSNNQSGEIVHFRIYLASTDEIVDANEQIVFQDAGEAGTMTNPFIFTYLIQDNLLVQGITLSDGQSRCFNAYQTINVGGNGTSFSVFSGGSVYFIAGEKISMLPGVTVSSGGYLKATITTTGNYCINAPFGPTGIQGDFANYPTGDDQNGMFSIFPNPTDGRFVLVVKEDIPIDNATIRVFGQMGNKVFEEKLKDKRIVSLDLTDLRAGCYLVSLTSSGKIETRKVVKLNH